MGSEKTGDLVLVQTLASLVKLQAPVATNLTKELRTFSTTVQDINMEFTIDVHRSIELLCCYESQAQRLPDGTKEIVRQPPPTCLQFQSNRPRLYHNGLQCFKVWSTSTYIVHTQHYPSSAHRTSQDLSTFGGKFSDWSERQHHHLSSRLRKYQHGQTRMYNSKEP